MVRTPASNRPSAPAGSVTVRDLFTLDSQLHGEIRGERSLMAFPFFALFKSAWMKPLTYDHATVSIAVRPSASGVATIYDKEIVLYIASLMAVKLEAGESVEQDFVFTAHDLFQRHRQQPQRAQLRPPVRGAGAFAGYADQDQHRSGRGGGGGLLLVAVRGEAPLQQNAHRRTAAEGGQGAPVHWVFREILLDRHVLDYAAAYFQLGPIERRIYEVARSTCENGPLDIDLATFRLQIGYQNPLLNFKAALKQIVATDGIPDFHLELVKETEAAPADGAAPRRGRNCWGGRITRAPWRPIRSDSLGPDQLLLESTNGTAIPNRKHEL